MKANMGTIDRLLRIVIAIVAGMLYFTGQVSGTGAILLGAGAVIFIVTGFAGFCPLYPLIGISTQHRRHDAEKGARKA
jgi:uncharacterized membrane protein YuzA (DUF378 family)